MEVENALASDIFAHLANRFQEWFTCDIANGTADLDDDHVCAGTTSDVMHAIFNFVGDVWDNLNGTTQVFSPALFANHRGIDLSGGHIICLAGGFIGKTLVVAEVEIGFCAIIRNKDVAMLVGRHGTAVHIDVMIPFHEGNGDTTILEQSA